MKHVQLTRKIMHDTIEKIHIIDGKGWENACITEGESIAERQILSRGRSLEFRTGMRMHP